MESSEYFGCKILTTGVISNTNPAHYSNNPHETNTFICPILHQEDDAFHEHIEWILEGDTLLDVRLEEVNNNPDNVRLYGYIRPLIDQPSLASILPIREKIKFSGENFNCLRVGPNSVTFNFTIKRRYLYLEPAPASNDTASDSNSSSSTNSSTSNSTTSTTPTVKPKPIEKIASSTFSIIVLRSEDVFNKVFVEKYLDAKSTVVPLANGREMVCEHTFVKDGKTYTYKNYEQFIKDSNLP